MIKNKIPAALVLLCACIFSAFTVYVQVRALGLAYLEEGNQIKRHMAVLHGVAGSPWQYRVLSEYPVEGFSRISRKLNVPHPIATAFISFRIIQNILIFAVAAAYYRRLSLNTYAVFVGLSMLAWGMTHSLYDSDLGFNTYSDVLFYLAAGLAILATRYIWIIPITILAAFNRETSGLIPVMLIAACGTQKGVMRKRNIIVGVVSLAAYILIFLGLRHAYAPQVQLNYYGHYRHGIDAIRWNSVRLISWMHMFGTMGILPILAIFSMRMWPAALRRFFWAIVPLWFGVHFFMAVPWAESRYFLVPQALIFIPGVMTAVAQLGMDSSGGPHGSGAYRIQA